MRRMGLKLFAAAAGWAVATMAPALAGDITFWTWRQEDRAGYTALFAEFMKQNPDIHVKFEAFAPENYNTIVSTALAGGHGGDVLQARSYGGIEQLAKSGYLVPLDETTVPELANLPADAIASETLRSDGRVYALSYASQTLGILINKAVFAQAGLQPPADWDELKTVSAAFKAKGIIPIANGIATAFMDETLTGVFPAPFLDRAFIDDIVAGRKTFSDPRYVDAIGHLLDLKDDLPPGASGIDYATAQQLFVSGRAAIFAGGSYEIANFRKQNPKIDLDFIPAPAPKGGEARPVMKYYDGGYAVNAKSANQADALKLVRWMGTPDYGTRFSALLGNISPIKGVANPDPLLAKVATLNETALPYIMVVYFRYNTPTGSELLQPDIQKMWAGAMTPQQVGDDLTQGISRYYAPFQKK